MMMLRTGSAILYFLSAVALAEEAPKLTVVVSPNPVSESESVQLRIELVAQGPSNASEPDFTAPDFNMVGAGSSGGTTSIMENGKITVQTRLIYSYVLIPKKSGILTISNISMRAGNQTLKSEDVRIKVEADGSASTRKNQATPPPGDEDDQSNPAAPGNFQGGRGVAPPIPSSSNSKDIPASFNSDFTVHAAFSKKSAYVGEPIIVEYFIYDFGGLRQLEIQKWPSFNGFWKDDLEITTRFDLEEVYVGNRPMRRAFVGRYALYGIKPGRLSVDKLVVRGRYISRASFPGMDDEDPISIFMSAGNLSTGIHASQDVNIEILPLPESDRPEHFGGAVGSFELKLSADKATVPANSPVTITATIEGRGNFQSIDGIKIPLPPDFEIYESTTNAPGANPVGARRGLDSKKSFQKIVIPRKPGTFQIPAISWNYFDPEKKTYQTLTSKPIDLTVTESMAGAGPTNNYSSDSGKQEAPKVEELRYLKSPGSQPFRKNYFVWLVYVALAANLILLARFLRSKRTVIESAMQKFDPFQKARASLKEASSAKNWQNELEESAYCILEAVLKTNPRGITRGDLQDLWRNSGYSYELFQKIEHLLSTLDQERFAKPSANQDKLKQNLIRSTEEILKAASKIK